MNELTKFNFNGNPVNITDRNGGIWFVAKDVCMVLEISNYRDAVSVLDDDEKAILSNSDISHNVGNSDIRKTEVPNRGLIIISESGFYKLVFRSRKQVAKAFTKWVTSEVLPAIRKQGYYGATQDFPDLTISTARLLEKISNDLDDGVEVKGSVLRYCSCMARLCGMQGLRIKTAICEEIEEFAESLPRFVEMTRKEILDKFKAAFPGKKISGRRFWPEFRSAVQVSEKKTHGDRVVEIIG